MPLTNSQLAALAYIREYARSRKLSAQNDIAHICKMSNITAEMYEDSIAKLKRFSRVVLHFHPDRLGPNFKSVAEALHEQGFYKSQFETFISNGKVAPLPGEDRDLWEHRLYGGAYNLEGVQNTHRPKYGALDLLKHSYGPAPRFGSCYFVLKNHVSSRCTFTYLDSHQDPKEKGTLDEFEDVMSALLTEIFSRNFALGEQDLTVPAFIHYLLSMEDTDQFTTTNSQARSLNHYIEAQIHGNISLLEDVETLVADPSFQKSSIGNTLEAICRDYNIQLAWHAGFALELNAIPLDFRGATMPSLAKRIATESYYLDTQMIGSAASSLKRDPHSWSDRGTYDEVLQELKLLWHVLVTFGKPLENFKNC